MTCRKISRRDFHSAITASMTQIVFTLTGFGRRLVWRWYMCNKCIGCAEIFPTSLVSKYDAKFAYVKTADCKISKPCHSWPRNESNKNKGRNCYYIKQVLNKMPLGWSTKKTIYFLHEAKSYMKISNNKDACYIRLVLNWIHKFKIFVYQKLLKI